MAQAEARRINQEKSDKMLADHFYSRILKGEQIDVSNFGTKTLQKLQQRAYEDYSSGNLSMEKYLLMPIHKFESLDNRQAKVYNGDDSITYGSKAMESLSQFNNLNGTSNLDKFALDTVRQVNSDLYHSQGYSKWYQLVDAEGKQSDDVLISELDMSNENSGIIDQFFGNVKKGVRAIAVITKAMVKDIQNFDINNQSEEKVLESTFFSAYKGIPVIRIVGNRSGSFGIIFLTQESNSRAYPEDVVRHEYGHVEQLRQLGLIDYVTGIFIPSASNGSHPDYYTQPWEITADIWGGVQSRVHSQDDIDIGLEYFKDLQKPSQKTSGIPPLPFIYGDYLR